VEQFSNFNQIKTVAGRKFRATLAIQLKSRLDKYESITACRIATLMDPRFKKSGFNSTAIANEAVLAVREEIRSLEEMSLLNENDVEMPKKKQKTQNNLMGLLSTYVAAKNPDSPHDESYTDVLANYLDTATVHMDTDVYQWWHARHTSILYKVALKYLSIPATSVPSERLFSQAGILLNQKRSKLTSEHTDMILFLNQNLSSIQ
jgi:hypothetical protein